MATDTGGGGDFKVTPSGNHVAICNMVVDLGKQRIASAMYGESVKRQIYIRWELVHERIKWTDRDGKERDGPMTIGKSYTLSLHENATLRADLENWRGRAFTEEERKGFDVAKLLGVPAMVSVTHADKNGKTYANVSGVAGLPRGMDKPQVENPLLLFDADTTSSFSQLPEWLQKKIDAQVKDEPKPAASMSRFDDLDDDVPF